MRGQRRTKVAFTLIEMLVVIGIIMLLMGLTLGAMNTRRTDKLVAAEHLVADMVRQGRHSARTSGAPVLLRIDQTERTIAGVVRTPSWGTTFDGLPLSADPEETPLPGNVDGYAGRGLLISGVGDTVRDEIPSRRNHFGLPGTVGFYLSCAVRAPVVAGGTLPLLAVTRSDSVENSVGGLMLVGRNPLIQDYTALEDPHNNPGFTPPGTHAVQYELQGWLGDGSDIPPMVSNLDRATRPADLPDTTVASHLATVPTGTPNPLDGWDFSNQIVGGRWMQVGLLYDGEQLVLFHNGRRVGATTVTGAIATSTEEFVAVGRINLSGGLLLATNVVFDNIRVDRLMRSRASGLPVGVVPEATYRILCLPDGRVEVDGGAIDSGGGTTIILRDSSSQRRAEVTVTATGSVTTVIRDPSL